MLFEILEDLLFPAEKENGSGFVKEIELSEKNLNIVRENDTIPKNENHPLRK